MTLRLRAPLALLTMMSLWVANPGIAEEPSAEEPTADYSIANGRLESSTEFPEVVLVDIAKKNGSDAGFCTGTILADKWVLTAAHCFSPEKSEQVVVYANTVYGLDTRNKIHRIGYKVKRIIDHPRFRFGFINYHLDAALLELERPISDGHPSQSSTGRGAQRPANVELKVPVANLIDAGTPLPRYGEATIAGRGLNGIGVRQEGDQRVRYPLGNAFRYVSSATVPVHHDCKLQSLICAETPIDIETVKHLTPDQRHELRVNRNPASCVGDSGGPMYKTDANGVRRQVGIVSHSAPPEDVYDFWEGDVCGRVHTYYSSVSYLRPWIDAVMNANLGPNDPVPTPPLWVPDREQPPAGWTPGKPPASQPDPAPRQPAPQQPDRQDDAPTQPVPPQVAPPQAAPQQPPVKPAPPVSQPPVGQPPVAEPPSVRPPVNQPAPAPAVPPAQPQQPPAVAPAPPPVAAPAPAPAPVPGAPESGKPAPVPPAQPPVAVQPTPGPNPKEPAVLHSLPQRVDGPVTWPVASKQTGEGSELSVGVNRLQRTLVNKQQGNPAPGKPIALLASEEKMADALASGVLQDQASLYLTNPRMLEPLVADELKASGMQEVWVLGGPNAVSDSVLVELEHRGIRTKRIAGADRTETALAIAKEAAKLKPASVATTYVARAFGDKGDETRSWADSIALGGLAASTGNPVFLTATDQVSASLKPALTRGMATTIIGGNGAVAPRVAEQIAALTNQAPARIAGLNRADTAAKIAAQFKNPKQVIVIDGQGKDAWQLGFSLAGLSSKMNAPILLAAGKVLPPETKAALQALKAEQAICIGDGAMCAEVHALAKR